MMASSEQDVELQKIGAAAEAACKETSPDSKCPICLDRFRNVSYADRCFHRFCFRCILEWGKNKAECPLCKQPFSSVYHSVRSEDDFKLHQLRPSQNGSFGSVQGQRFRYRTTLTHQRRRDGWTRGSSHRQEVLRFRRWLYRHGVRVRGVRDGGRSRDTSAEFFRKNPACLHRLVPWLKRELAVLYGSHDSVADVVLQVILSLITRLDMQDETFLRELRPFLSSRTEHFLHEFLSFAKSPFNMEAYDHHAVYDCPAPSHMSVVSEDDADISSAPSPWDDETPGPSYSSSTQSMFTVTVSDSDVDSVSDEEEETVSVNANATANINVANAAVDEDDHSSDGDCVIIGFIKPSAQRTPELVQLSSDSDTSVQEEPEPATSRDLTNQRSRNTDDAPSHSGTKHNSKSKHRGRDFSSHSHRRRSRSLSYKHRRRSRATNHSSPSHMCSHTPHRHSRYTDTHYSRDTPLPARARSRSRTHSRSRSRTRPFSRFSARARSRSRSYTRSWTRTRARSGSSTRARSGSSTRARSGSSTRARSRSRTRARSRSRTRARSRSRTRARSRSRTRARFYSVSWRMQATLQNRKCSVSPSPSSHRRLSHDKLCGKQQHKSLHGESRRRRSREKRHHHKKKKKRRRSSSMEVGAERRKQHHHKKKKHKRERRNRSKRMGRGSGASSPTVLTIHTDPESAEEATSPRDAATPHSEPLNSCPTCANTTTHNSTASNCASDKTPLKESPSYGPSNITPPNNSP
ncbi:topoisomerase I binding, arginine/serine-rich a [Ictalurus furcatus]|uniref:topoisomerase I binding, arginine/serine-rich a n=1 Tax=Ictalurus furcatus TaxID=66913 RepID=UPI00234FF4FC|nr:topoisomerase I binding, arginine/serine-rich a [Ictalurus furcatus]